MAVLADNEIHQGAVAPYGLTYDVTSADVGNFDLATVTSARFDITRENGTKDDSWAATLSAQTTTTLTLTHVFAVGDVPDVETLIVTPVMTAPSGEFFAKSRKLRVRPPSEL